MENKIISIGYVRLMARYNRWQNRSLYRASAGLDDAARRLDRGAFFGSIHGTLSHLLWGDAMWMSRFDGWDKPDAPIRETATWVAEWDDLKARREAFDAGILDWADRVSDADLADSVTWFSAAVEREVSKPLTTCIVHFFNHQTHHRGQVHTMLTSAGTRPDDTDIVFMPEDA